MDKNESKGEEDVWVVARTGERAVIGRLAEDKNVEEIMKGSFVELAEAFDYQCGLQQVQHPETGQAGLVKGSICSSLDSTAGPVPLYLSTAGLQLYFFSEMQSGDRAEYKRLVENARKQALQSRAQRTGISLPGAMPAPPTPHAGRS